MGSRLQRRALGAGRALVLASVVSGVVPTTAHADIWCRLFGAGCSGSGNTSQRSTPRDAPEIDAGSLTSAIALAAGGAAMLRDRVRRRR